MWNPFRTQAIQSEPDEYLELEEKPLTAAEAKAQLRSTFNVNDFWINVIEPLIQKAINDFKGEVFLYDRSSWIISQVAKKAGELGYTYKIGSLSDNIFIYFDKDINND